MGQFLPLIGMGMTVGSNVLSGIQQQQLTEAQIKAEHDAYMASRAARLAEIQRQAGYQTQADTLMQNTDAAVGANANAANRVAAEKEFNDLYASRGSTQPEGQLLSGQGDTTDLIKGEIAKRAATAAADARSRVKALAKVGSFDDAMQRGGLALQQNSSDLNTLGGMRRGSLAVAGQEASIPAAQVIAGNNLLSPILGAAGGFLQGTSGTPGGFGGFSVNPNTGQVQQNLGILNGLYGAGGGGSGTSPWGGWVGNI